MSRTFRDEDGFMVTKKEMASASESDNEAEAEAAAKKKPEPVVKTPEKSSKGKTAAPAAGNLNAASKKQASIMNFFKKK